MKFLKNLGIKKINNGASTGVSFFNAAKKDTIKVFSPNDGKLIGEVVKANKSDYDRVIAAAQSAFITWREVPAPKRGEFVRRLGEELRKNKTDLGMLVSYEMGKSLQEGMGEVQEMIDICDFAVGLSRQLYGLSMHSERAAHRMYEQWHPLGIVSVITSFNFPVAVWAWNTAIALVAGDVVIWKPSSSTPLAAVAVQNIVAKLIKEFKYPEGLASLLIGPGREIGDPMLEDERIPLVSFTGSTNVGKTVSSKVATRFGRTILELGGNNAIILTPNTDLKIAIPAIVFGAVGTAGQRCTTTRRLIVHDSIYELVKKTLVKAYKGLKIGSSLDVTNHVGPLIDQAAVATFLEAIEKVKNEGGKVLIGGEKLTGKDYSSGCFVYPAVVEAKNSYAIVQEETFAPILYLIKYTGKVANAIALQNGVKQGLSSSIFTTNLKESEAFLSAAGSDCGIANVNIGTSGAEIGGAFGGEKETGGGRESGSDAWKVYMRRQTNTINYSDQLPLAQGIKFDI